MVKDLNLVLTPRDAAVTENLRRICASKLSVRPDDISAVRFIRKSIDSRRSEVKVNALVRVFIGQEEDEYCVRTDFREVSSGRSVVIVGSGPAGLFAALSCL